MIKLLQLDIGVESDIGAPMPIVLSDDYRKYLLFYLDDDSINNGEKLKERDISQDKGVGIISFNKCLLYKFGMPSSDILQGHPYYKIGLRPFNNYEVINSDWLRDLIEINSIHPNHDKNKFASYRHFIFTFHDSMFECIAENFEIKTENKPLKEIINRITNDWLLIIK